jgi:hypothetical protein
MSGLKWLVNEQTNGSNGDQQMTLPAEFEQYRELRKSEDNLIQRFLKPLVERLGYYSVRDYHGTREFGKDLVYAEVDKFAEVTYHGLQAKFEESISLRLAEDLALDAIQAFTNPFEHPSTHQPHRIATFVAVNAGSISEQARTHFFNRVGPHAGSCRIFDGKDLLGLDRIAFLKQGQAVTETLDGLLIEANFNRNLLTLIVQTSDQKPRQIHLSRLSDAAGTSYLVRPLSGCGIILDTVLLYVQQVRMVNKCLDGLAAPINLEPTVGELTNSIRGLASNIMTNSAELIEQIRQALSQLRPLAETAGS